MFQAVITLVYFSTVYTRKVSLAYVPAESSYIDIQPTTTSSHRVHGPTLTLKVMQVRNYVGPWSDGDLPPLMPHPLLPFPRASRSLPSIAVRAYPTHDDKIKLPRTDGDSKPTADQLKKLDEIFGEYGFMRDPSEARSSKPQSVRSPRTQDLYMSCPAPVDGSSVPIPPETELWVKFVEPVETVWRDVRNGCEIKPFTAAVNQILTQIRLLTPTDDDDVVAIHPRVLSGNPEVCVCVPKAAISIPPSRSVEITFLDDLQIKWIHGPDWVAPASVPKNSTLRFKAVLENPLNPDQVALVLQDNRFAHVSKNCFRDIKLPAGDLTSLPSFPKKLPSDAGREGPITCHVVGGHKPDDESMLGFVDKEGRRVRVIQDLETMRAVAMRVDPNDGYTYQLFSSDGSSIRVPKRDLVIDYVDPGSDIYYELTVERDVAWQDPEKEKPTIERMKRMVQYNASRLMSLAPIDQVPVYQLTGVEGRTAEFKTTELIIYQINPQQLPHDKEKPTRIPHIYGWIRFNEAYNAVMQLADDGVSRRFAADECVMVRTLKDDGGDTIKLWLFDGHTWKIPRRLLSKVEHALWIQMRVSKKLVIRTGIDERVVDVVAGERLLVRNMTLTGMEADVPYDRDVRSFSTGRGGAFSLREHEYRIGETAPLANCHEPGEVNSGLTSIFFKLPEIVADVATTKQLIRNVKIPKGEYLARLVEVKPHRVTITMPDFSYFVVDKNVCTLIGGHAIEDPCNNAPYRNAVAFAQR